MSFNGNDPDLWHFGNELTINGCQPVRDSAPASPANGVTNNPGNPASDRQPPVEDPNTGLGNNRRRSLREPENTSSASVDGEDAFRSLKDEVHKPGHYCICNDALDQLSPSAVPRGYPQLGSTPREIIDRQQLSRQNIPRSGCAPLSNTFLEMHYASDADGSTGSQIEGVKLESQLKLVSMGRPQTARDPRKPRNQHEQTIQNRTIKQYCQGSQSRSQEYRQIDTDKDSEEDAETEAGPFQDPDLDGNERET